MKLLRYVLTLVLVVAVASPLLAGEGKKGKKGAKPKAPPVFGPARILEGLTLTADQKEQVEKIRKEFEPKLEELRKKMAEVLTPEQRSAQAEAMKAAKQAGKKGDEAKRMVDEAVKLTDEQKQKLADLRREFGALEKEARMQIMNLLTPEQKAEVKARAKKAKEKK